MRAPGSQKYAVFAYGHQPSSVDYLHKSGVDSHSMGKPSDLVQGTLDLLILKTLLFGAIHGQGIARAIQRQSEEVFFVDHGSLYLALQRLEDKKWISAKWGVSENNRKARFYSLTAKGREQLATKTSEWQRLTRAMELVLGGNVGAASGEA